MLAVVAVGHLVGLQLQPQEQVEMVVVVRVGLLVLLAFLVLLIEVVAAAVRVERPVVGNLLALVAQE